MVKSTRAIVGIQLPKPLSLSPWSSRSSHSGISHSSLRCDTTIQHESQKVYDKIYYSFEGKKILRIDGSLKVNPRWRDDRQVVEKFLYGYSRPVCRRVTVNYQP